MRLFALLIAFIIAFPPIALAQSAMNSIASAPDFYFGAVATGGSTQGRDGSFTTEAGGLVGISFTREDVFGAIEAEYAAAMGDQGHANIQSTTSSSISLLAGVRPSNDLSLFGRFGFQRTAIELTDESTTNIHGLRLGIGADYEIGGGFHARAEVGHRFLNGNYGDELSGTDLQMAIIQHF